VAPRQTNRAVLDNVTVVGGLTLQGGDSLELRNGSTATGPITVDSSSYLFLAGDETLENLTLIGGNVGGGLGSGTVTISPNALVQGYGVIYPSSLFGSEEIINKGTINADVNGQSLDVCVGNLWAFFN
jgi:hypothetical protein